MSNAQKRIMELIINIRPEFSNFRNPNHRKGTVLRRLDEKFAEIDRIVEAHTPERIGRETMEAIERERSRWAAIRPGEAAAS